MIVPGSKLEKYEVLEKVGEGGMATVYRGRHSTLGREVAIKVMHPHLASSEKNRTRFEREARAIETLRHPNILRIFDYSGDSADQCFIITEFIEGPTLRELLDEVGAMMPEPAALVTYELCRALEVAHERGIVHRDVKPENVMITPEGGVKLMDFGIARMLDDAQVTMTGALVGSPAYMSPEQATDGKVSQASDLFAVGTMLYRMVTGTLPFRGSNPSIVIKAIIDGIFEDPANRVPSLSPALADIIRRCLNRDLEVRYASATGVREDLRRCLEEVGIDPDAPGRWSVREYLADPEPYEEALRAHLLDVLVTRGRREAEAGRTSEALRTFNRVLALDEDNMEVVSIIEGMRSPLAAPSQASTLGWVLAAIAVAVVAGVLLWQVGGVGRTHEVAALAPAVLIPSLPVPFPDSDPAPPDPTPEPEPTATPGPTVAAVPAGANLRRLPTPAPPSPTPSEEPPDATPGEPEVCEGQGIVEVQVADNWTRVYIDGRLYKDPRTGSDFYVDRSSRGRIDLDAGTYRIRLADDYRVPQEHVVQVCGGRAPVVLRADRPFRPHRVAFAGFPEGAQVFVNDVPHGPAGEPLDLAAGEGYLVRVILGDETLESRVLKVGAEVGDALPGDTTTLRP